MISISEINQDLKRLKECLRCDCVLELMEYAEKLEQANDILSQSLYAVLPQAHKLIMLEIKSLSQTKED